ncbi:3-hydroxyisobutyrate dehydrogenase [Catellatospora methionotrophica]|uniref:3-hydroxyisobutyrate dehydrogenase n=1 Tax=Catellatospora methionotrophica TaxID=121620 RepID=A0A8J3L5D0_9ACTN|nr:NAD(P)-dependent oxidoreductase [Catellatospora methionotrophica]GIG14768.1 3-hydroxyisobutyrate dehydrogenase [Catellatospora methionotrophica]
MSAIGYVGLGTMGGRMAGRLLGLGHQVYGTNRTRAKADPLAERGLIWCDTPRAAAAAAPVVFSMVTDDDALAAITSGPDGILAGLTPGKLYIDMSTVSPTASSRLGEQVRATGAHMLAAPVSGSVRAVDAGSLAIIVGGDTAPFDQAEPLLRQLGTQVTHVGDNAQALLLKLAINDSLAVQLLAFSEGVLLAERGGVDREKAIEVMLGSAVGSPSLRARAGFLLDPLADAWFDVALMQKDIRLALAAAAPSGLALPAATVADGVLTRARDLGYADRDIAVMIEVLGRAAPS